MNLKKVFFAITIISILILLILTNLEKQTIQGKISEIKYGNNKISIYIENSSTEIIIFTNKILNLKKGDKISATGKQETYKNQIQFVADKIEIIR